MLAVKNILVGTDFSETSQAALNYGRALAKAFDARLHVLHVVEPPFMGNFDLDGRMTPLPELQFALEDRERKQLEQLLSDDDRTSLGAVTAVRTLDTPAHALIDYAATHDIDMIVMGTHGRRGLAHLVVGSVAEQVVRNAGCPVVTMRQPPDAPARNTVSGAAPIAQPS